MAILEERGVFWWNDEEVPDNYLAPDSYVAGRCRIEDDGRAVLELDGCLPSPHGTMAPMVGGPVTKCIQGLFKESGERILLSDLERNGGQFSTHGISFEEFLASSCLVGREGFPHAVPVPKFDTVEIPLTGFEEWLRLGAINFSRASKGVSASYEDRMI